MPIAGPEPRRLVGREVAPHPQRRRRHAQQQRQDSEEVEQAALHVPDVAAVRQSGHRPGVARTS